MSFSHRRHPRSAPHGDDTDTEVESAALPPRLATLLAERGIATVTEVGKLGLRRPVRRFVRGDVVVELATSPRGRARVRREVHGRRWAQKAGIGTAAVHGSDPDGAWLVAEWLDTDPDAGPAVPGYLDAACEAAARIAAAEPPPEGPAPMRWRSPRHVQVVRAVRGVLAGVPMRLWWAAREAAGALPRVPVAHNDFYHRNVLLRPASPHARVVDWEYLGPGPRHGDLVRMWTVLPTGERRAELMDRLLRTSDRDGRRHVAALALYLSLRLWGENAKAPRADRSAHDLAHARTVVPEAKELARAHGAWPL